MRAIIKSLALIRNTDVAARGKFTIDQDHPQLLPLFGSHCASPCDNLDFLNGLNKGQEGQSAAS
jgi:hypothetical protein